MKTVETRRQLWWRKEKSRRKGKRTARQEQYTYYTLLSKGCSCMTKIDALRSSIADRPYPSYRLRRQLLRRILLIKSQEDNK
ncbi:hypothetical protein pdam_00023291 [Pocillopora damicornis]|uniref:Uncharacterized protein n=1 Tax=Pocillopora damicornis TaxID=46731 RepID=A0A3M6U8A2_POCDA|nr:hypothetical protein pdam_00023291 [Pocillopora damicornis]